MWHMEYCSIRKVKVLSENVTSLLSVVCELV